MIFVCYDNFFYKNFPNFLKNKNSASLGDFFLIIHKKGQKRKMSQNQISKTIDKKHNCNYCHYSCSKKSDYKKHILTIKHKKNSEAINGFPQNPSKNLQKSPDYICSQCNYFTKKISEFNKHMNTIKHTKIINENPSKYQCKYCEKEYNKKNSCTKHEKLCILQNSITTTTDNPQPLSYSDIINSLIQENQELRNFMTEQTQAIIEQNKIITGQTQVMTEQNKEFMNTITEMSKTINTTNNQTVNGNVNNNNKFNINLFLNEKCKDAINLSDFLENIEVSYEDLENNAQLGFVNGMSKIILDNLKQLSIYERPLHCTDVKRETMYIKDENKWEKEEDTKKLSNVIRQLSRKSMATLCNWRGENPDEDMDSELSNKCIQITQQCSAGGNRDVLYPKIIRTLAKETVIDKNN